MATVPAVLLDLGGVRYMAGQPLPGALEAVARLCAVGLVLCYVTNIIHRLW